MVVNLNRIQVQRVRVDDLPEEHRKSARLADRWLQSEAGRRGLRGFVTADSLAAGGFDYPRNMDVGRDARRTFLATYRKHRQASLSRLQAERAAQSSSEDGS